MPRNFFRLIYRFCWFISDEFLLDARPKILQLCDLGVSVRNEKPLVYKIVASSSDLCTLPAKGKKGERIAMIVRWVLED